MGSPGAPLAEQRQRVARRGAAVGQRLGGGRVGRQRVQARLRQRERDRQHARRALARRLRRAARHPRGGGPAPRPRGSPGAAAAGVAALCARRGRRAAARRACARRRCSCIFFIIFFYYGSIFFFFLFSFFFVLHDRRRPRKRRQHAHFVGRRPAAAAAAGRPGPGSRSRPVIIEVHQAAVRIRLVRAGAAARGGARRIGRGGGAGVAAQGHTRLGRQRVAQGQERFHLDVLHERLEQVADAAGLQQPCRVCRANNGPVKHSTRFWCSLHLLPGTPLQAHVQPSQALCTSACKRV